MNFTSLLHRSHGYSSLIWRDSQAVAGIRYAVRRISLQQRIELTQKIRELALRHEFLNAGNSADQLEATLSDLLVQKLYLEWGLAEIQGLNIDGKPGTIELLIKKGPEALTDEIVTTVRAELTLSEDERKNF